LALDSASMRQQEEAAIPKEFKVYTKRSKTKPDSMTLCVNLVSPENIYNYCREEDILRDPEVSKILFEKKVGDTTFVLVYVEAFSKPTDKPSCAAGKEIKLFYFRWNTNTNKAFTQIRTVESCMRNINNMTKEGEGLDGWDKSSPLIFKNHKGSDKFYELKFEPKNYQLGLQTEKDL
jgi:hypothetical protein